MTASLLSFTSQISAQPALPDNQPLTHPCLILHFHSRTFPLFSAKPRWKVVLRGKLFSPADGFKLFKYYFPVVHLDVDLSAVFIRLHCPSTIQKETLLSLRFILQLTF